MKKSVSYFGKGCEFFSGQWEDEQTCRASGIDFKDTCTPVLVFCGHENNKEKTEGNCRKDNCPLHKEFKQIKYHCENGAYHTSECCATCWNKHPQHQQGTCFINAKEHMQILRKQFIQNARRHGFTHKQAIFLYKIK